jgi:hypothetical protein
MATIEVRTAAPDKARLLLHQALDRERRLLLDAATGTRQEAAAKSLGTYPHHKHRASGIVGAEQTTLTQSFARLRI